MLGSRLSNGELQVASGPSSRTAAKQAAEFIFVVAVRHDACRFGFSSRSHYYHIPYTIYHTLVHTAHGNAHLRDGTLHFKHTSTTSSRVGNSLVGHTYHEEGVCFQDPVSCTWFEVVSTE